MGWKALVLVALVFLAACEPPVQTTPVGELPEEVITRSTSCSPTCNPGFICKDQSCVCPAGKNECDGACISGCCTSDDCSGDLVCIDQACIEPETCKLNEVWKGDKCGCAEGFFYCGFQEQCVPNGNCCRHTECDTFERCVPTVTRVAVCLQKDLKKVCKAFTDNGKQERFNILDEEFLVSLDQFNEDNSVSITVSNETITIPHRGKQDVDGISVFYEDLKTFGGFCKEDESDF